jgi:hypothetical protein
VRVGAYDYLTKPFSLGQLDVILARICDRTALERKNRELNEKQAPVPYPRPRPVAAAEPVLASAPMPAALPPAQPASFEGRLTDVEQSLQRIELMLQSLHR